MTNTQNTSLPKYFTIYHPPTLLTQVLHAYGGMSYNAVPSRISHDATLSNVAQLTWSWPQWEYLHHGNGCHKGTSLLVFRDSVVKHLPTHQRCNQTSCPCPWTHREHKAWWVHTAIRKDLSQKLGLQHGSEGEAEVSRLGNEGRENASPHPENTRYLELQRTAPKQETHPRELGTGSKEIRLKRQTRDTSHKP